MKSLAWLLVIVGLSLSSGCTGGGDAGPRLPTIPVKGVLSVDGKPYGPCVVFFTSTGDASTDAKLAAAMREVTGKVKADGTFVLTTYVEGDGAIVGSYAVKIGGDTSDVANMSKVVPVCKPLAVDIQKPTDGKPLVLDLKLESTGETIMGVDPGRAGPQSAPP